MLFYGLENMVKLGAPLAEAQRGEKSGEELGETVHLKILTTSYALYVFVVCYVMAHEIRLGQRPSWRCTRSQWDCIFSVSPTA